MTPKELASKLTLSPTTVIRLATARAMTIDLSSRSVRGIEATPDLMANDDRTKGSGYRQARAMLPRPAHRFGLMHATFESLARPPKASYHAQTRALAQ